MIRGEMAEYYSSSEMGLRDSEHFRVQRGGGGVVIRENGEDLRTLSSRNNVGFSSRDSDTSARFQWGNLLNDSRADSNGFGSSVPHIRNYDGLVDRSLPGVSEGTRSVAAYDPDVGGSRYAGRIRNVNGLPIEDDRREYSLRGEGESFRQPYDNGNDFRFLPEEEPRSLISLSHSRVQRTPFQGEALPQEVEYRSADGIGSVYRVPSSRPSSFYHNAVGPSHTYSVEGVSPRGAYAPAVHNSDVYVLSESQRSSDLHPRPVLAVHYDGDNSGQDYTYQEDTLGVDVVNGTLPRHRSVRYSHRDDAFEDEYSGHQILTHPRQESPSLDNYYGISTGYVTVNGGENIGRRSSYPEHRREETYESLPREEQIYYERNPHGMSYEQQYASLPRQNERNPLIVKNTQHTEIRDITLPEHGNTRRKRRRPTYSNGGVLSYGNRHLSGEDVEEFGHSNRITDRYGEPHSRLRGASNTNGGQPCNELHVSPQRFLTDSQDSGRGDVKKRLTFPTAVSRPSAPQLSWVQEGKSRVNPSKNVTQTKSTSKAYVKAEGTKFKKKLKLVRKPVSGPSESPDPVVVQSELTTKKQHKLSIKNSIIMNDTHGSKDVDPDLSSLKVKPLEFLPEDCEKFKLQVDEWCMKCLKHLNENIGRQKKFMAQGNGLRLKCIICPSSYTFPQTKDVAMHAFSSIKMGYRAQHLGFHRALCILMGWDRAADPDGRWMCQSLPEPVARSSKQDIIIWPPVVIIHSYPGRDSQLDEVQKGSIDLKSILREKGFSNGIKGCYESPENPNIMLVEFFGTGWKEAVRLHNFFAKNKHGRADMGHVDAKVVYCKVGKPEDNQKLVGKNGVHHEQLDNTKDEQSECKTEDHQKLISKGENDDEPLVNTKVDHLPVDMSENDQELVDKPQDNQDPISAVKVADDKEFVGKARGDLELVGDAQDDQGLLHKARDDREPVDKAQNDQELDDQVSMDKAKDDQGFFLKSVHKAQDDQEAVDRAQNDKELDDQMSVDKTKDVQGVSLKSVDKALDYQEPVDKAQNDQELDDQMSVDKAKDDQGLFVSSVDDKEAVNKAQNDKELDDQMSVDKAKDVQGVFLKSVDKARDDQEPVDKAPNDQELDDQMYVDKANDDQGLFLSSVDKVRDDQEAVDKAQNDQELDNQMSIDKAKDDQEGFPKYVDKALDDQEVIGEARDDQELLDKPQGYQKSVVKAQDDQELEDKSLDDQESGDKSRDDQEPVNMSQDYQVPLEKVQNDQEPVNYTEGDSMPVDQTSDDQIPAHKIEDCQEPLDKTDYIYELVDKVEGDQKPLEKEKFTLYGYLGTIIEDFNKLHDDMKCHHVAKSKKEIIASFNAVI